MSLNVHPVFVHFPIAFLTVYAVLELLSFTRALKSHSAASTKIFLLFVGEVGTVAAGLTGKLAAQDAAHNPNVRYPQVIQTHSAFAELTFVVFGLITVLYLAQLLARYYPNVPPLRILGLASEKYYIMAPLALIGLVVVTITGTLGGIVVYGPDIDPLTRLAYRMLIH